MITNIKYMFSNWLKWDKKGILYFILLVPVNVIQPIIIAYIPKAIIDCINNNVSVIELIIVLAILSVLVVLTTWLTPFLKELLHGSEKIICMRYAVMAFKKNLNMEYVKIESPKGREENKRAMEFYCGEYSPASNFIQICNYLLVCFFGIIASAFMIYKMDFIIILLIVVSCLLELVLLKILNKADINKMNSKNNIFVKFDYFYELAKDSKAAKDIRFYNFKDCFLYTIAKLVQDLNNVLSKYLSIGIKVGGLRALLTLFREVVAYAYLTYLVCSNKLTVSDFIFYFGIITGFSNWLTDIIYYCSSIEICCKDCKAFRNFVESKDENENKQDIDFKEIENIEFKNVSFSYPSSNKDTINNMSFKISKGENIAIVGENGAGKTTLIKLLCGLYYPTKGNILINGKNCNDFSRESYFNLFSVVFQDFSFLPMTIAENVCASSDYDKKKLYEAFEKSGILDKINSLANKENSLMIKDVYNDAVDFSGGEKQKLLLAKAIYKDSPILILDEPTSALDPIAENELYLKYNEMTNNKISFFISHRLSSTRFCDKIMFIKDGKISECGTHDELMALKGSYYKMFQIQSYYYKEMQGDNS